jgi:hypothetical protein
VGPRAVLDEVVKRKIPSPRRESNSPVIQPVAQRYTDWAIPVPLEIINAYKFWLENLKVGDYLGGLRTEEG